MKAADVAMDRFIDAIVRRSIRHARLMLRQRDYEWPTARKALTKILADLETRSPDHPSLRRLRMFIASNDRAFAGENPERRSNDSRRSR
jgi:hypothetical protein